MELYIFLLISLLILFLASGYPVAFCLGGASLLTAGLGFLLGDFDPSFLNALPERLFGIMTNESLLAIPLFVFMGMILEKSNLAKELLETMGELTGKTKTSLALSVFLVGALLAASTGIVGATVVTMGLISLPSLLKKGVPKPLASGVVAASGTLGQIIPPSLVLIVLGDVMSTANQQAQLNMGVYNTKALSVGDLFAGAVLPGCLLVFLYMLYVFLNLKFSKSENLKTENLPPSNCESSFLKLVFVLLPPLSLVFLVLGSILFGVATPTEAASVGCAGALFLSFVKKRLSFKNLKLALSETALTTSMIFLILIGANILSVVFRGFEGDEMVQSLLLSFSDQPHLSFFLVMLLVFALGFFLDFFEITFVVIPLVGPSLIQMGMDPIWLGVMFAMNLQTSFLSPPFGFSLFYLRGVAPKEIRTQDIYTGVLPFIGLQVFMLFVLWYFPGLATALPEFLLS